MTTDSFDSDFESYKALSKTAVLSVALSILGIVALAFWQMLMLPLVGLILGLLSLSNIRRFPHELTGRPLAMIGVVLCGLMFVGGTTMHVFIYMTEVPDGYQRVSFYELKPSKDHPELPVSPKALELNGERIFVKGYVHPAVEGLGKTHRFVLVPDMGTCCFGGQPKPTDMIDVKLTSEPIRYSTKRRKLAGTFRVNARPQKMGELENIFYELEADYLK